MVGLLIASGIGTAIYFIFFNKSAKVTNPDIYSFNDSVDDKDMGNGARNGYTLQFEGNSVTINTMKNNKRVTNGKVVVDTSRTETASD
jgi:hypothetical protein